MAHDPDGLVLHLKSSDGHDALLIEDNGRVAYAYILDDAGDICGEVWLYNRCAAPDEPEWSSPDKLPFANPKGYVRTDAGFELPTSASDFSVRWSRADDGGCQAEILIRDRLVARLTRGGRPGWCVLAAQDGPLARMLAEDQSTA